VFLAHFTGGGISTVLELPAGDFCDYLGEARKLYEMEMKMPRRVILAGIEKR
jgi:hypothetical protein